MYSMKIICNLQTPSVKSPTASSTKMTENLNKFQCYSWQLDPLNGAVKFRRRWFHLTKGFFQKNLIGHYGCVNAIELSDDGQLLFSGSDDCKILMWHLDKCVLQLDSSDATPTAMKAQHLSNVFCLSVDSFNQRVLSGGNDNRVIIHDYSNEKPLDFLAHESPVLSISLSPSNSLVYVIATEKGKLLLFDSRDSGDVPQMCISSFPTPFRSVMHNPTEPMILASANASSGIHLWDVRRSQKALRECSSEKAMAVRWNGDGRQLLCLRQMLPPLLLDVLRSDAHLEFDAKGFFNSCTLKSCCFAGDRDDYILCGSDDFNLYLWKIPDPWPDISWVSKEHLALVGHRSIVNQVRYCSRRQLIVSSGVEKLIKIWSPYKMPNSQGNRDEYTATERARKICCTGATIPFPQPNILLADNDTSAVEDERMLHFFDGLLLREFRTPSDTVERLSDHISDINHSYTVRIKRKKKYLLSTMRSRSPSCLLNVGSGRAGVRVVTSLPHAWVRRSSSESPSSPSDSEVESSSTPNGSTNGTRDPRLVSPDASNNTDVVFQRRYTNANNSNASSVRRHRRSNSSNTSSSS